MSKLFIIGLPRTGTTSISVALLDYGFKVAHTAYTKQAFALADVISDAPCFCDYQQLDKLFPHSKFVYLERALIDWLPSIQMLLHKMQANLNPQSGSFNPVLKRCFNHTFSLLENENLLSKQHLEACYTKHQQDVMSYFADRNDFLRLYISKKDSFSQLLSFLGIEYDGSANFPQLNIGKQVDSWKQYKHPNKVNSYSAGKEHRKFFDYSV
jgi:hypothetical protein